MTMKDTMNVSVSLRSYIHSYTMCLSSYTTVKFLSFRLLTELYSFLYYLTSHSKFIINEFPSPYGVSFILIIEIK